jgi:hypothetical protein
LPKAIEVIVRDLTVVLPDGMARKEKGRGSAVVFATVQRTSSTGPVVVNTAEAPSSSAEGSEKVRSV